MALPTVRNLLNRETGSYGPADFHSSVAAACFSSFTLQASYYVGGALGGPHRYLRCPGAPPKVVEIVAGGGCVFSLTLTGICSAFCQNTGRRLCWLNRSPSEVVRGIFYNKMNQSLVTVSAFDTDDYKTLTCRSIPVTAIKQQRLEEGLELVSNRKALKWLSFVEFDDINNKVLIFSVAQKQYMVYEMKEYRLLYCLSTEGVKEVKLSLGILMLVGEPTHDILTLRLYCVDTGVELAVFEEPLVPGKKLEFAELFNDRLLLKQQGEPFRIRDLRTGQVIAVEEPQFATPTAFIFLFETQLYLTLHDRRLAVWNAQGENVARFEDHTLCQPDYNTNHIYITTDERLIVSYCTASQEPAAPSITVSEIRTGRCLAQITGREARDRRPLQASRPAAPDDCPPPSIRPSPLDALADVTAILYDEAKHEIYTGDSNGWLHVWSV